MREIFVLLKGNINYDSRVQKEIDTFISLGFRIKLVVWNWEPVAYKKKRVEIVDINLSNHSVPQKALFTFLKLIKFWYLSSEIIRQGDVCYVHCNDLDTLGVLFFLPKKYNNRVIYDAHELFPERFRAHTVRYIIWNLIEKILIKRVRTIIVPETNRAEYLRKKYKLKTAPYVIDNFPKYRIIKPKNIRQKLGIGKDQKIICYQGIIAPDREIEVIIESLKYLSNRFLLVLFGYAYGEYIKSLEVLIAEKGVGEKAVFYGKVSPKELLTTIAQCDVGIALYKNDGINNYLCAPNKVFDFIMAGVKVISNDYPSLQMLKEYRFVRLISKTYPKSIAEKIMELVREKDPISETIRKKFSWEYFNDVFRNIYY